MNPLQQFIIFLTIVSIALELTSKAIATSAQTSTVINKNLSSLNLPLHLSPQDAARSLNSIDFLEELVKIKDTADEKYYGIELNNSGRSNIISVVEYTGRLWFMNRQGIQFQESIKIGEVSKCGTFSTIECVTKYKSKSQWIDCSKVFCTFVAKSKNNRDAGELDMKVRSELLIPIPLLGIGGSVRKQITKSFQAATQSYFQRLEDISG